ncbi:chemotaxis protein CheA [Roseivivax sediminis]|uniref:Chemotaxis protein CheA n=1 Tax=Roseivivax sediminis TaxID=936889 RepID=A0A1I1XMX2_9RHOB|nr:chemotaxis protein CheA [Roseivivax sediminis]SFE08739.1 two-component system, chemotaxis family, sensor kinase CheA [Roseivivax sediminis]
MSSLDDIKQMFFLECDELLEALNDGLADIEASMPTGALDPEVINAVFRTVHSIKGGAASFGLEAIVRFSHCFETVLDQMRAGKLPPDAENIRILQRCADHLADLVAAGRADQAPDTATSEPLVAQLNGLIGDEGRASAEPVQVPEPEPEPESDDDDLSFPPLAIPLGPEDLAAPAQMLYRIDVTASAELFATGHEPVHLFRELAGLGDLTVRADTAGLPDLETLVPETPYLRWRLELATDSGEEDIREVFEFVDTLATVNIEQVEPETSATIGPASASEAASAPRNPSAESENTPLPLTAAKQSGAAPPKTAAAEASAPAAKGPKSTVRVDLDLVDSLINIVGELVINQSVLTQSFSEANVANRADIGSSLDEYKSLALQIQESVMSLRAQSVKQLFQRMARIVRETSEVAGKSVQFDTEGEDTEIDKTVIERLIEPLTHILRNAIDHGLETAESRLAAGKSETGTVCLSASHRSGRVLIEVSDDGAGIDRKRVFEIAASKGLIAQDAQLSEAEIDRLLFLPGFSTKAAVSDLSGRGVGMDVVQSAIRKLGGRVAITSAPGRGTTFSISLPLTLAVLDGMVVDVAGQTMVVPITAVLETIRPTRDDVHMMGSTAQVIKVRDTLVPIVDLGLAFGYRSCGLTVTELVLLLIETEQGERWALAVDRIIDQRQVVIKSLEGNYGHVPGVAAATILGDGKIALIIDPEETAQMAERDLPAPAPLLTAIGE